MSRKTAITPWFTSGMLCLSAANLLPWLLRKLPSVGEGSADFFQGLLAGAALILLLVHALHLRRNWHAEA